jgi:biotin carboxyl carrier protein
MKMEVSVEADDDLEIVEVLVVEGSSVRAGQALVVVKTVAAVSNRHAH